MIDIHDIVLLKALFGEGGSFTPHERSMLKALTENPENHNGIYRGKDLSNIYTWDEIYARVHDGSFEDLYLGDYKTVHLMTDLYTRFTGSAFVSGVTYYEMGGTVIARTWTETQDSEPQEGKVYCTKQVVNEDVDLMIAHFDYYLGFGGTSGYTETHHVILIPKASLTTSRSFIHCETSEMLSGYVASDMHNITLPCYAIAFEAALNGHIVTRYCKLPSAIDETIPSMAGAGLIGSTTNTVESTYRLSLCTENQIFGTKIVGSSWRDICQDYCKFAVYNFVEMASGMAENGTLLRTFAYCREVSGVKRSYYAYVNKGGAVTALYPNASPNYALIRPYFLFG